jgi:hypothetical protein
MSSVVVAAVKNTNAAGDAVFTFPAGMFAAPPVVDATVQLAAGNQVTDCRVTAVSAAGCTVRVSQSAGLNVALLNLTLLGVPVPVPNVPVHIHATPADPSVT